MKNAWFKHYNSAHEGHLVGNLIANQQYDAMALWWVILEFVSKFETDEERGKCTVPLSRIARAINMKPSRCERLLLQISSVSSQDLQVEIDSKPERNVSFLLRNWLELQENRGGKRESKKDQKADRGKKEEVRSKNEEERGREEPSSDGLPHLATIWNQHCGKLAKVTKTNSTRNKKAAERLKEDDEAGWIEAVKKLSASSFCNGNNDRGWKATFDFILQPEARLKILEGFYDGRSGKKFSTERDFDANAEIEGIFKEVKRGITANQ